MLWGVVHDPTARRMGGVAGHAGLFSEPGTIWRNSRRHCSMAATGFFAGSGRQDDIARDSALGAGSARVSAGTSILRSLPIAAICFLSVRMGIPALPVHRYGSIRLRTRTSSC